MLIVPLLDNVEMVPLLITPVLPPLMVPVFPKSPMEVDEATEIEAIELLLVQLAVMMPEQDAATLPVIETSNKLPTMVVVPVNPFSVR